MMLLKSLARARATARAIRVFWHKQGEWLGGSHVISAKGEGFQWADVRPYQYGDESKWISWKHTARSHEPLVKTFEVERSHRFVLLLDRSSSMVGGILQNRFECAWLMASVLGYVVLHQKDICMTYDSSQKAMRRRLCVHHDDADFTKWALEITQSQDARAVHSMSAQILSLGEVIKKRSSIIVFTDGYDDTQSLYTSLKILSRTHEVIVILFPDVFHISRETLERFQKLGLRYLCVDSQSGRLRMAQSKYANTEWFSFWTQLRLPQVSVHVFSSQEDPLVYVRKLLMK